MNIAETVTLVKTIRAIQPAQTFDDDTPRIWQALLRNVDVADALAAVEELAGSESFIGTDDILRQVRKLRHDRLGKFPAELFIPPPGLTDGQEREWAKEQRRLALAGAPREQLIGRQGRGELVARGPIKALGRRVEDV